MMNSIPLHLQSTVDLLKRAYPDNQIGDDYYSIIKLLYDDLSDRNLARVLSEITKNPSYQIINDIYMVANMNIETDIVKNKLKQFGYDTWLNE